jgi:hypothetical protein
MKKELPTFTGLVKLKNVTSDGKENIKKYDIKYETPSGEQFFS